MDLTVIIPSFNTKQLLDRCLSSLYTSLAHAPLTFEVIVVDNGSKDGSIELLNKKYTQVKKILNKSNVGYGKANNQAIKKARGEYVLLLNSDIEVKDAAIERLLDATKAQKNAFAGGKLLNEDGSPQASCGPFPTLGIVFLMLYCKGDALGITRYSPNRTQVTDWVSGACLIGKRNAFVDVGYFDERIFMYMEEIDLLYRASKKGYTTLFVPQARFIHTGAASSGSRRQPVTQIFRGLLYFYTKHRSIIEQRLVALLLVGKAKIALILGKITNNTYLIATYEEALSLVGR